MNYLKECIGMIRVPITYPAMFIYNKILMNATMSGDPTTMYTIKMM